MEKETIINGKKMKALVVEGKITKEEFERRVERILKEAIRRQEQKLEKAI